MKRIFIIAIIITLFTPITAYQPEEVVYSKIAAVEYEKHDYMENMTYFDFTITGQIVKTVRSYVTITTPDSRLYEASIITDIDQEITGGFAPLAATFVVTDHIIRQGIQNYSIDIILGISGNYDVLPDGKYTVNFQIVGDFNYIPYILVIQEGNIEYTENLITFTPGEPQNSIPTSFWYIFFLLILILMIIKSIRKK